MTDLAARQLTEILGPFRSGRQPTRCSFGPTSKLRANLVSAIAASGLRSGGVVSFHHHYRNGDHLMNSALEAIAGLGLRDLTLAASSIFPVHEPLVGHLKSGVVRRIITSYVRGPVADFITSGQLDQPIVLQSHGGRARAICSGQLAIDLAIVGASVARRDGAATGRLGHAACGPLGYAMVDAGHAKEVIVAADCVAEFPERFAEIPAQQVDYLVETTGLGDPSGILSGVTVPLATPLAQLMGRQIAEIIRLADLMTTGFCFQTGSGGYSLGSVPFIGKELSNADIRGDYISGGITGAHVQLVKQGFMARIRDVQSFDLEAVQSAAENDWHEPMSAEAYASPHHPYPAVDGLTAMFLGAAEIDLNFNVNVAAGGDGRIIGGPGGHPDAAFGANLAIVATPLLGGGFAKLVEKVTCCTTPGRSVGAIVTDAGIALHPDRIELSSACSDAGLPIRTVVDLIAEAKATAVRVALPRGEGRIIALVEDRNGQLLDTIRLRTATLHSVSQLALMM